MTIVKGLAAVGGGVLLTCLSLSQPHAQTPPPNLVAQEGVEVETRGPIHEAFAQPMAPKPFMAPLVAKRPPDAIEELPPDEKPEGDQAQWIPGYWAWDDDRQDFMWVSGLWRVPPSGRRWLPGYWQNAQGGASWISGYWAMKTDTAQDLLPAPPEPVTEALPPQPNVDTIYAPGTWIYQDNRYMWRPGHWVPTRAGWVWVPARYFWTPGGYVFVRGYWDYELEHRGLTFAPVVLDARFYRRPGWIYRPYFTISADFYLGSLFVNVNLNRYFFGDYYAPLYATRGFTPWIDYRVRGSFYDPLFSYYRWQHRGDARWENNLRATYVSRRENVALRPPHTLIEQNRAGAKIVVATPLNHWKGTAFKLEPVTKAHAEVIRANVQDWRKVSVERARGEVPAKTVVPIGKGPAIGVATKIEPVHVEIPKTAIVHPEIRKVPPPHPELPKAVVPPQHEKK